MGCFNFIWKEEYQIDVLMCIIIFNNSVHLGNILYRYKILVILPPELFLVLEYSV